MTTTAPARQIPGLSAENAAEIRAILAWHEACPLFLSDRAVDALCETTEVAIGDLLPDDCPEAAPTDATETGFLWDDEDGDTWEHLCA